MMAIISIRATPIFSYEGAKAIDEDSENHDLDTILTIMRACTQYPGVVEGSVDRAKVLVGSKLLYWCSRSTN
jgi:hypothetical protein